MDKRESELYRGGSVKVFAPATIANLACGFDVLGLAIDGVGDILEIEINKLSSGNEFESEITIQNECDFDIPIDPKSNVITPAILAMFADLEICCSVVVKFIEKIRPGSGIGSSAASSSAAVFGLNRLLGDPYTPEQLVQFAMQGEALISGAPHADNVAPCLMGGIVLTRDYDPLDLIKVKTDLDLHMVVVHPHLEVKTKDSRAVLKSSVPMKSAIKQWGNMGALIVGLMSDDIDIVGRAMRDVIVEPVRKLFIPGFDELQAQLLNIGATAASISGAGPSVFAVVDSDSKVDLVEQKMRDHFDGMKIESDIYSSKIGKVGCREI